MTGNEKNDVVDEELNKTNLKRQLDGARSRLDAAQSKIHKIESLIKQTVIGRSEEDTQVDNGLDEANMSRQVDVTPSPGYQITSFINQTLTGNEKNNQGFYQVFNRGFKQGFNAGLNATNLPQQMNVSPSPGN